MRLRPILLAFTVLLVDCATLEPLPTNACGNGVVDAREDCDTFPNDATGRCGAPSEGEAACRLHCGKQPSGETFACPEGWGCSVRGLCREPSARFDTALAAVSAGVTNVAVGDFDGDGRKDVLGTGPRTVDNASRVRVHYFDDVGGLAQAVALPSQLISPSIIDFDRDGRDDITFGLGGAGTVGGLGALTGLVDRRFLSVLFPAVSLTDTEAVPISVQADRLPMPTGNQSAILLLARSPKTALLTSIDSALGTTRFTHALPVGPEALRGRPLAARVFDANPLSTCGEIVAAVETPSGPRVYLFSPCTPSEDDGKSDWSTRKEAFDELSVPAALGPKGVLVADPYGTGHLSIIVDGVDGSYIAKNVDGKTLLPFVKHGAPMPLAAADFNQDGIDDLVFDKAVALSIKSSGPGDAGAAKDAGAVGEGSFAPTILETAGTWTDAITGNFNGDAFPDFVVRSAGSPDLKLYASTGSGAFNVFTVTTDNVVERIAKGDFDGDQIEDIAISQVSTVAGASDLAIAYGRGFGGPEPSRVVGRIAQPQGLLGITGDNGAIAGLGVYTYGTATDLGLRPLKLTLLQGSGDRQPLAPLFYFDSASTRTAAGRVWQPVTVAPGAFQQAGRIDVFSYAVGRRYDASGMPLTTVAGAWLSKGDPAIQGGLAAPVETKSVDNTIRLFDTTVGAVNVATANGDVDNASDNLDEVVVVTNDAKTGTAVLQVVQPGKGTLIGAPTPIAKLPVAPGAQLELVDVDGDGFRDVVCVLGAKDAAQVFVILNDGKGGFGRSPLVVPTAAAAASTASGARGFALVTVGGAPALGVGRKRRALAVATERSVVLATLRDDRTAFDARDTSDLFGANGLSSGTGIAAGDFNGDGVDDLAVADSGTLRLILQIPARQR